MNVNDKIGYLEEKIDVSTVKRVEENFRATKCYITVEVTRADGTYELICKDIDNVHNTGGIDYIHYQGYTATATGATSDINTATIGSNYLALSSDTGAPSAGDTSLTGEIITNGLQRAQCTTRSHTASTNVTTLAKTFTASGSFTAVQKGALFNASSSGVMNHEFTFASTNLNSGDSITLTITVTGG